MSKILITGGAGFIGSHLVDKLVALKHDVVVLDNLSTGNTSNIEHCEEAFAFDINDNLDEIFEKYQFDYVFHLAAFINLRDSIINPKECFKTNVIGSINLIDYCVKYNVKKIIFSSTGGAIYHQEEKQPWTEKSLAEPTSPYGLSKLVIEQHLKMSKELYGLDYTILRYSNVYGPRQDAKGEAGVIAIFINQILKNQNMKIFGTGEQTRDFIYVEDVVKANVIAMKLKSDIYNVSTNKSYSVNDIANMLLKATGSSSQIEYSKAISGEVLHTRLSHDKLSMATNWSPSVDIADGIEKTIRYFKD